MKAIERTYQRPVPSIAWQCRHFTKKRAWLLFQLAVLYAFVMWLLWMFSNAGGGL